jgi:hypothetical protein
LRVSDKRLVDTAGLVMYRHRRSSFSRSLALAATPVCRENPADAISDFESGAFGGLMPAAGILQAGQRHEVLRSTGIAVHRRQVGGRTTIAIKFQGQLTPGLPAHVIRIE